jgi:hypothetical protein
MNPKPAHNLLLALLFILFSLSLFAQPKTVAKLPINKARLNRKDCTAFYVQSNAYLVFYLDEKDSLCLANVVPKMNSQSFGRVYLLKKQTRLNESFESYPADFYSFKWNYENTYDSAKGTADVELVKIYKPHGATFSCTIRPDSQDKYEYSGSINGTINFAKY